MLKVKWRLLYTKTSTLIKDSKEIKENEGIENEMQNEQEDEELVQVFKCPNQNCDFETNWKHCLNQHIKGMSL